MSKKKVRKHEIVIRTYPTESYGGEIKESVILECESKFDHQKTADRWRAVMLAFFTGVDI